ncbi:MAG TPA: hypothetical protein VFT16_06005 [Candidatus Saccharimonadales bacterium]|nr:hypothetical protein [Candidatus Saccharimonadales bacterium]
MCNAHLGCELHDPDPDPKQLRREAKQGDILIANYEDLSYKNRGVSSVYQRFWSEKGVQNRDIVVVRDWYNIAASRVAYIAAARAIGRHTLVAALPWASVADTWADHARILADRQEGVVAVNYNRWFTDQKYTGDLADCFGVPRGGEHFSSVPAFGSGSSFDGLKNDGNARSMNVLRRWENLDEELLPEYMNVINESYAAVDGLNRQLFGFGRDEVLGFVESGEAENVL